VLVLSGVLFAVYGCGHSAGTSPGPAPAATVDTSAASRSTAASDSEALSPTSYKPAANGSRLVLETDPTRIVREMVTAYKSAETIDDTSEAKMYVGSNGNIFIQQNSFKFKKPALLVVKSEDPHQGTLMCYNNGLTVTLYVGKQNVYTKLSSPGDLAKVMDVVESAVPQVLSPGSFLLANGTLREADRYKLMGRRNINGHDTYVVKALVSQSFLRWITRLRDPVLQHDRMVLFIDTRTHLLVRGSCDITWSGLVRSPRGGMARMSQGFRFDEDHMTSVLNAPIEDKEFYFNPPKNAAEIFHETK
jgi:hypothetical protein